MASRCPPRWREIDTLFIPVLHGVDERGVSYIVTPSPATALLNAARRYAGEMAADGEMIFVHACRESRDTAPIPGIEYAYQRTMAPFVDAQVAASRLDVLASRLVCPRYVACRG